MKIGDLVMIRGAYWRKAIEVYEIEKVFKDGLISIQTFNGVTYKKHVTAPKYIRKANDTDIITYLAYYMKLHMIEDYEARI